MGCCASIESWGVAEYHADLVRWRTEIDFEAQNAVLQSGDGITDHGVVLKVNTSCFDESLAFWPFHWGESSTSNGIGAFPKTLDHLVGIKGICHNSMLRVSSTGDESVDWLFGTWLFLSLRLAICGTSEELL